jgi:hypothetical protein
VPDQDDACSPSRPSTFSGLVEVDSAGGATILDQEAKLVEPAINRLATWGMSAEEQVNNLQTTGTEMTRIRTAALAAFAIVAMGLAGCVEDTTTIVDTTPTPAQQACLAAVSRTANTTDVSVLSSMGSEAGTQVKVGVGPDRAQWNCIAYSDGTTAAVQFDGEG